MTHEYAVEKIHFLEYSRLNRQSQAHVIHHPVRAHCTANKVAESSPLWAGEISHPFNPYCDPAGVSPSYISRLKRSSRSWGRKSEYLSREKMWAHEDHVPSRFVHDHDIYVEIPI